MELTRDLRAAAEACGCALVPATDEQVRRLAMQRRVFRLDGEPVLATRDGGYFETHATLAALIGKHAAGPAKTGAAMDGPRPRDRPAASSAEPAAASGPEPAEAKPPAADLPTPAVDPRPAPAPLSQEHAADVEAEGSAPAEETGVDGGAIPTRLRAARTPGQRRAGQPKPPRWVTAGKERRGRLK